MRALVALHYATVATGMSSDHFLAARAKEPAKDHVSRKSDIASASHINSEAYHPRVMSASAGRERRLQVGSDDRNNDVTHPSKSYNASRGAS